MKYNTVELYELVGKIFAWLTPDPILCINSEFALIRIVVMAVAIFLHIYYDVVARDILMLLRRIPRGRAHLFISHSTPLMAETENAISALKIGSSVYRTENRGRDILPFLSLLASDELLGFDYGVKIHTKRVDRDLYHQWSKLSYEPLVKVDNFKRIYGAFEERDDLLILGTRQNYVSGRGFDFGNKAVTDSVSEKLFNKAPPHRWGFFAGTMFWFRLNPYLLFRDIKQFAFEPEPIMDNRSLVHGFERAFGLLPIFEGGSVGTIDYFTNKIEVMPAPGNPSTIPMAADWELVRRSDSSRLQRIAKIFR